MDSNLTKAQHYRDQARQMRDLAAKEDDQKANKALIELAEMYDRLCRSCVDRSARDS